jgi:hypothetical protein
LWMDLLWWVKEPKNSKPIFTAPTWSWVSINSPISHDLGGFDTVDKMDSCIKIIHLDKESTDTISTLLGKVSILGRLVPMEPQGAESEVRSPKWRPDFEGTDLGLVECLIIAVSLRYVYTLGLVAVEGEDDICKRVGLVNWRVSSDVFGGNEHTTSWDDESKPRIITLI